jgi:PAS domain S-box-containing protein
MTAKRESRKRKTGILIVEDSPTQAQQLEQLLKENGFKVLIAGNGKEALASLEKNKPELVISDILMPEMDGYELCRQIKADEKFKDIPVILDTVLSEPRDIIKGLECGADNFVIKPYDEEFLLSRIHYVLSNRQIRQKEKVQMALQVTFAGAKYAITSDRLQILNLLLSTYEIAVLRNLELAATRDDLKRLNEHLEDLVKERTAALTERVKELECLYSISALVQKADSSLEKVIQDAVDLLPQGWQYPEITCARVILDEQEFATANFRSTAWRQSSPILVSGEPSGRIEVYYLEERPECDEGPFLKEERKLIDDIARQLSGFVERQRAQEKLKHLNLVLRALRKVNQLITQENDTDRLIKSVSESLVSTRGYYSAWIALLDESGKLVSHAEAGIGKDFLPLREQLQRNELPACSRKALERAGAVIIQDTARRCAGCPLAQWYAAGEAVTCRLEHGGTVFGTLTVSGPASLVTGREDVELTEEVASDIALGISNILREKALRASEQRYRTLFEQSPEGILIADVETRHFLYANPAICRMLGYSAEELSEMGVGDIHPKDELERVISEFEAQAKEEKTLALDIPCLKRDGTIVYADINTAPTLIAGKECNMGFFRDTTQRRAAEEALRASEEKYRILHEFAGEAVFTYGTDLKLMEINKAACDYIGGVREELLGKDIFDLYVIYPEDLSRANENIKKILTRAGTLIVDKIRFKGKHGLYAIFQVTSTPIIRNGQIVAITNVCRDVTIEEQLYSALEASEKRYKFLFNAGNDAVFVYELTKDKESGKYVEVNDLACATTGYSREELLERTPLDLVAPEEKDQFYDSNRILSEKKHWIFERTLLTKEGHRIQSEISSHLFELNGVPTVLAIVRDISERKKAEENLRAALKEKDVMLREIHHRVKNNMQIMASLLRLQARQISDEKAQVAFVGSQTRIRSMALIHEKLYQSENFSSIDFADYIEKMVTHLFAVYQVDPNRILFKIDVQHIEMDINRAIPCGLIINELISNALKHAFPEERKGELTVRMFKDEGGKYHLIIKDKGCGLPESIDIQKPQTLGLQIVADLTSQLEGKLDVRRDGGTEFEITF